MSETSKIFGHFNVRILRKGEKYGLKECLTHKECKTLVEFYDYRHRNDKEWKRGQFVSRYYAETLLEHDVNFGLSLDGGIPEWTVSADYMREILAWLRQELRADELPKLSDQLAENNLSQYALQIEANRLCNQYARALIRAMYSEYNGVCWLGKLNPDFGAQRPGLQKYTHGMVYNFACDLVLPEFDIEIDRMLREYRTRPEKVHLIEKIRSRVKELQGHWVYWS